MPRVPISLTPWHEPSPEYWAEATVTLFVLEDATLITLAEDLIKTVRECADSGNCGDALRACISVLENRHRCEWLFNAAGKLQRKEVKFQ